MPAKWPQHRPNIGYTGIIVIYRIKREHLMQNNQFNLNGGGIIKRMIQFYVVQWVIRKLLRRR